MHFYCLKEYLEKAVIVVERIAGKVATLPVLQNILIHAKDGKIEILATDLEMGVRFILPGKIQQEGSAAIPARLFTAFVHKLPNDKIECRLKQNTFTVRAGAIQASFQTALTEEFPIVPSLPQNIASITFDGPLFLEGLVRVIPIVSMSEVRPELSGVLVSVEEDGKVALVATDTFRLGESILSPKESSARAASFILPLKAAQEIVRMFADEPEIIFFLTEQQVFVQAEGREFLSRLIEGAYPAYQAIIPQSGATKIILQKNDFLGQLQTVGLFSGNLQDIHITVDGKNKHLALKAKNEGVGESEATTAASVSGEPQTLAFNWRYLIEGVQQFPEGEIEWWLNNESSPSLLKAVHELKDARRYRYVIMPLHIS